MNPPLAGGMKPRGLAISQIKQEVSKMDSTVDSKIQDKNWIDGTFGVGQLNNTQLIERIRELESLIGEAWYHWNGRTFGHSWNRKAKAVVEKAEQEEGTFKRKAHRQVSVRFFDDIPFERQKQIGMNLLNSFDKAEIGASLSYATSITIKYEEPEICNWFNVTFDEPNTKAGRIVKRWLRKSAKGTLVSR
jgi:hypothetical protein